MMTDTTFFHLTPAIVRAGMTQDDINLATSIEQLFYRPRQSYIDAPLASTPNKLPVIVMTHGDAGSRYNMENVCEYLAANGYVVIAREHTGNSPYSMTGSDPALAIQGGDKAFRQARST
jgi:predicted dienelactone hydrolase